MAEPIIGYAHKDLMDRLRSGQRKWLILTQGLESDWKQIKVGGALIVKSRYDGKCLLCRVNEVERLHLFSTVTDAVFVGIDVEMEEQ